MGKLTTHVLDTMRGQPGRGIRIKLFRLNSEGEKQRLLMETAANADGRCDSPLLSGAEMAAGDYLLEFYAGDYFRASGVELTTPAFLDVVPIRFGIANPEAHYHVPLLIGPYSYSTYRGS